MSAKLYQANHNLKEAEALYKRARKRRADAQTKRENAFRRMHKLRIEANAVVAQYVLGEASWQEVIDIRVKRNKACAEWGKARGMEGLAGEESWALCRSVQNIKKRIKALEEKQ
jgi:hypothetical protein